MKVQPRVARAISCDPIESNLVLDFSNLRYAASEGADLVRTLVKEGAEVRAASPFIQLLLGREPREDSGRSNP